MSDITITLDENNPAVLVYNTILARDTQLTQIYNLMDSLRTTNAQVAALLSSAITQQKVLYAGLALVAHLPKIPYLFAGTTLAGFDCSWLTHLVYAMFGVNLPHSSAMQSKLGTAVPKGQEQCGDLMFFDREKNDGIADHCGIFVFGNLMLHTAGNPEGIAVVDYVSRYGATYMGARRFDLSAL